MQTTLNTLLLLAIAFLIAGAGGALAQTGQEQDIACEDAAGGAESSNVCALEAWKKADAELNRIYRRLRAGLPEGGLAPPYTRDDVLNDLTAIQKLWVQLRDADCGLLQGMSGGGNTGHFDIEYGCYLDRTQKRIAELQALEQMIGK
jgi:uncharacterized protein YecT (DUF1311 family)